MLGEDQNIIEYFEIQDGEFFCIQALDEPDTEPTDIIVFDRNVAIDLAHDILRILGHGI